MKYRLSMNILVIMVIESFAKDNNQAIISETYSLDGDFNQIQASGHIEFELIHVNHQPNVIIETEQWVHANQYITISTRPNNRLEIKLTNGMNYPAIKVYVNYRTPLVSLDIEGTSIVRSKGVLLSNPSSVLTIAKSGSGNVMLQLQHASDIIVAMSGIGELILSGQVDGTGQLSASGTVYLNAINCPMKIVRAVMSGTGFVYVNGIEGVHATVSGVGTICYRGPLLSQVVSGLGVIKECDLMQTTNEPTDSLAGSAKSMNINRNIATIFIMTIVLIFFQFLFN